MTFLNRIKYFISVILVANVGLFSLLSFHMESFKAEENISMYSESYALMDADTGRVLKGKDVNVPMANASTTKILTCIVTLENCNLEERVTISSKAAEQPAVKMGMKEGEIYSLKDLLYGLMLESYNDCAVAIAEHVAGNTESFAEILNAKAEAIGCKNTYFITPNGLDAEDEKSYHHSTAEDLCKIMAYCTWKSPLRETFLQITQTRNYGEFINRNSFLNQMDGVLTGKTGFTNKAGYCYVAALEQNGERYCIALLACGWPNNKTYKWMDARTLFEYGMKNYDKKNIPVTIPKQEILVQGLVGNIEFSKINKSEKLYLKNVEKEYKLLVSETEELEKEIILYTDIKLPIEKGEKLGQCNLFLGDVLIDSIPLYASERVYMWGWSKILYTIFYQFLTFSL